MRRRWMIPLVLAGLVIGGLVAAGARAGDTCYSCLEIHGLVSHDACVEAIYNDSDARTQCSVPDPTYPCRMSGDSCQAPPPGGGGGGDEDWWPFNDDQCSGIGYCPAWCRTCE